MIDFDTREHFEQLTERGLDSVSEEILVEDHPLRPQQAIASEAEAHQSTAISNDDGEYEQPAEPRTNTMNDDRKRLLNGDWIVYNVVEGENFDLTGSKIAILTEKQRDKMVYYNTEPERIDELETYDLGTLVMWAIKNGFIKGRPACSPDDPQRAVFVVSFPLLERPGQTFAVVLDRGDGMRGYDEEDATDDVISELEDCDLEETDYPEDLDIDKDHVTCRRMTAAEAQEATNSSVNTSWWG